MFSFPVITDARGYAPGLLKTNFCCVKTRGTSSWHVSTVASMARHVRPRELPHPRPFTVTGPTRPINNAFEFFIVADKSHETCVCVLSLRLSAMHAKFEIRFDVIPPEDGGVGGRIVGKGAVREDDDDGDGRRVVCGLAVGNLDATIDSSNESTTTSGLTLVLYMAMHDAHMATMALVDHDLLLG